MERLVVYHNPKCSKSRGTLEILRERGVAFDTVEYLTTPPDRDELVRVLGLLPDPPADLVRKDKNFEELGLDPGDYTNVDAVAELLAKHPVLMQRPVVIRGDRAIVSRPSDKVLELLD